MAATSKKKARKKSAKKATPRKSAKKAAVKKTAKKASKKGSKKVSKKKSGKKSAKKQVVKKTAVKKSAVSRPSGRRAGKGSADSLIFGIEPYAPGRGEEYMNETQLDHFRAILRAWRSDLVDEINRTIHAMQDETINHPDPTDRATQETDMSMELRSRDRERKLIKKIDDTLEMIDSGDYGFCENCGVEIGIARLEARPTARLCIDCKTLDEIREKQMI